ncbi:MAG: hypothetical protein CVU56_04255 [Deltaproteobacteria bacterium HGW-Deltaproteobacteria-14]|jgi:putative nucleotidyltransferase with HDIG domain|nr:MAG: hypothetical protein CVU56_04255 [Deltaproteobacteria bacterium HGW-Deltaproteobacteria-14]
MTREAIRHTIALRQYAAAAAVELPIPPAVMARMVALMDDPKRDAYKIAEVVEVDPGLGADSLRIANSAAFAFRNPVTSIRQAVVALGERLMRELIARRMRAILGRPELPGYEMLNEGLWRHSIRCAAAAARLSSRTAVSPGIAYTAGLMADIGKLALAQPLRERWDEVRARLEADADCAFDVLEDELLGADHAEIGAEMIRRWTLPPAIVAAVAHHHHPSAAPAKHRAIANVIHVADLVAMQIGVAAGSDGLWYRSDERAIAALEITPAIVEGLMCDVESDVAHLEELLSDPSA